MNDGMRLAAFFVAVVVVFGLALAVGRAVGPVGASTTEPATVVPPSSVAPGPSPSPATTAAPNGPTSSHAGSHTGSPSGPG